ncbi:MAG: hypothetical protein COB20_05200 [SAR86 cluster bacterium]|uniref:Uncharacterized protein n=1 Tax=SAR86 cluster bacterium TaxID=2030880 RepID=A0A2A4X936_9GAMM|nr:MAG: hypothetical protein COB20_05200 [SAR86 cluster bacterium]
MTVINQFKDLRKVMIAMLGYIAFSSTAFSAEAANQTATQETEGSNRSEIRDIEEITVSIPRSFYSFRFQLKIAKEKLYSTYNDANEDDDNDVNCRKSDWTQTRINELICWPVFFEKIVAENAQDATMGLDILLTVPQHRRNADREFVALRENIQKVAFENPSVAKALVEFDVLEKTYLQRRAECMEKPAFLFIFRRCP